MAKYAHGGLQVIDPVKRSFLKSPEGPVPGPDLLDGFAEVPFAWLVGF
jgi:hypothetical protein